MSPRNLGRACSVCGTSICDSNRSGQCKPCNLRTLNADPDIARRKGESLKRRHREDPLELARRQAQMRQNVRTAMSRPEVREAWVARARKSFPLMWTPEALAKKKAGHAAAMRRRAERQLAWCPAHKRERYEELVYTKRWRAADAKATVLAEIRAELESLSPFERQMRALERGAKIVANDARPSGNQVVRRVG